MPRSRIDDTRSVPDVFCEFSGELLADEEDEELPVIEPAVLPLVPVGFVLVGFEGLVSPYELDGFDPFFSSMPRTSTRWSTYFDQSLLLLLLDAISASVLPLNDPVVPLVPVAVWDPAVSPVVPVAEDPLVPMETFVSVN